eukprot:1264874-Amphidinium_carterae.1
MPRFCTRDDDDERDVALVMHCSEIQLLLRTSSFQNSDQPSDNLRTRGEHAPSLQTGQAQPCMGKI